MRSSRHSCTVVTFWILCVTTFFLLLLLPSSKGAPPTITSNSSCSTRTLLVINAANRPVNWRAVEAFNTNKTTEQWSIREITLEQFGPVMKETSFQTALEHSEPQLRSIFSRTTSTSPPPPPPDALIVSSKGVGILTFLATQKLWNGPSLLLSPIPNVCDHIEGGSWENEWKSTVTVLSSHNVGPVVIGTGTSSDEQNFIVDILTDAQLCGRLSKRHRFEKCPSWFLYSFPGDHSWRNDIDSAQNIAVLIHKLFKISDGAPPPKGSGTYNSKISD